MLVNISRLSTHPTIKVSNCTEGGLEKTCIPNSLDFFCHTQHTHAQACTHTHTHTHTHTCTNTHTHTHTFHDNTIANIVPYRKGTAKKKDISCFGLISLLFHFFSLFTVKTEEYSTDWSEQSTRVNLLSRNHRKNG